MTFKHDDNAQIVNPSPVELRENLTATHRESVQRPNLDEETKLRPLKVLMMGEALYRQGGIVTFQTLLIASIAKHVSMQHIGTVGFGGPIKKLLTFAGCLLKLIKTLVFSKIDLVHLHVSLGPSFYRQCIVAIVCFIFRKPVLMHIHAGELPSFYQQIGPLSRWLCRFVFRRCDRLIMLTESWRPFYENSIGVEPKRLVTMANPVNLPEFDAGDRKSETCQFIYLGKMDKDKGTFDLLDAIAKVPQPMLQDSVRFIVAGNGEVERVREIVERLGLKNCVTVFDWVEPEQRDSLLAESDVFVLPSYFEGMPMSLLEAMSWSMPVITTPVGGIPDFVVEGENGLLVQPGDIDGLSSAFAKLANSADLRTSLGAAGRKRVESHCPNLYAKNMAHTYAELAR